MDKEVYSALLKVRYDALMRDADNAYEEGAVEEGSMLDKNASAINAENERRVIAAKAKETEFTVDQWESGLQNANDTFYVEGGITGSAALYMCEYWECVVVSAQSIKDC